MNSYFFFFILIHTKYCPKKETLVFEDMGEALRRMGYGKSLEESRGETIAGFKFALAKLIEDGVRIFRCEEYHTRTTGVL